MQNIYTILSNQPLSRILNFNILHEQKLDQLEMAKHKDIQAHFIAHKIEENNEIIEEILKIQDRDNQLLQDAFKIIHLGNLQGNKCSNQLHSFNNKALVQQIRINQFRYQYYFKTNSKRFLVKLGITSLIGMTLLHYFILGYLYLEYDVWLTDPSVSKALQFSFFIETDQELCFKDSLAYNTLIAGSITSQTPINFQIYSNQFNDLDIQMYFLSQDSNDFSFQEIVKQSGTFHFCFKEHGLGNKIDFEYLSGSEIIDQHQLANKGDVQQLDQRIEQIKNLGMDIKNQLILYQTFSSQSLNLILSKNNQYMFIGLQVVYTNM
ncbi:Transmembrane emp24 domain-containing protein 10 [Paramecium bursaria]